MTLLNIACNMQNMQNNMHDMQNMQMLFPICRICTAHFADDSMYLTTRSICLEYSDIYLEYVNPFPIPGICLEYA
jgi:aminopeptidase-like protein